jgi:hypothetical protein
LSSSSTLERAFAIDAAANAASVPGTHATSTVVTRI